MKVKLSGRNHNFFFENCVSPNRIFFCNFGCNLVLPHANYGHAYETKRLFVNNTLQDHGVLSYPRVPKANRGG